MELFGLIFLFTILNAVASNEFQFQFSEVQLKGECPNIRYITNFHLPSIVGWYYRAFSNLDNPLCYQNRGQTMYAAIYNVTHINADICCQSSAKPDEPICGVDVGSGQIVALEDRGTFSYEYGNKTYPIYVLDTDYVNFTVVYGCKPGIEKPLDEVIYVLSRAYRLPSPVYPRVGTALNSNGIKWSKAWPVEQGRTVPYTPLPAQCYNQF